MNFGETLKKIRLKNGDGLRKLAKKMEVAFSYIDRIEKGSSPISQSSLEKLIEVYPNEKEELMKSYILSTVPVFILENMEGKLKETEEKMSILKMKVYNFDTTGDGELQKKYQFKELIIPVDKINIDKKRKKFCIENKGNAAKGFYDEDIVMFEETTETFQALNKKIVAIEVEGKIYIRRVEIKEYIPYFMSLNGLYPPIKYVEGMVCLGVAKKLLYRNIENTEL